jgi:hypothetical protein
LYSHHYEYQLPCQQLPPLQQYVGNPGSEIRIDAKISNTSIQVDAPKPGGNNEQTGNEFYIKRVLQTQREMAIWERQKVLIKVCQGIISYH